MKSWSEICEKASIINTIPYRSCPDLVKRDRVKVTVDLPIEHYQDFRRHIEVPSLRGRRKNEEDTVPSKYK